MKEHNLDENINHQLATTANTLKRLAYRMISEKGLDITPEQWVILYHLWSEDGLPLGELSQRSEKDFANVTRIVDKLIANGYVKKQKNEADGRSYNISLLPHADTIKDKVIACWQEGTTILTRGMDEGEKETFLRLLKKAKRNLQEPD